MDSCATRAGSRNTSTCRSYVDPDRSVGKPRGRREAICRTGALPRRTRTSAYTSDRDFGGYCRFRVLGSLSLVILSP
jgi:hypothetical protein